MRCGCPQCGTYMIQAESMALGCVCPQCLYRCRACMGTDSVISRADLHRLGEALRARVEASAEAAREAEQEEQDEQPVREPLTPEDMID